MKFLKLEFFDKRDSFPFFIVRMPVYSAVGASSLRIARTANNLENPVFQPQLNLWLPV